MAMWRSRGARKDATRGTAPIEVRKTDALFFTRPGVIAGSASPLVTGTSGWTYNVGKAGFVTSRGEADGVHVFGNDGVASTPAVAVAPGSGLSRIDIIWVRHPAAGENSDATSDPVFGVTSGVAASTPQAPSIPVGALELARNTMSSSATSTGSAGNAIAQTGVVAHPRIPGRAYSSTAPGGGAIGTDPTWPSTPVEMVLPAGTYILHARCDLLLSVSTVPRKITVGIWNTSANAWATTNHVEDVTVAAGDSSRTAEWTRIVTITEPQNFSVRGFASASGGSMNFGSIGLIAQAVSL